MTERTYFSAPGLPEKKTIIGTVKTQVAKKCNIPVEYIDEKTRRRSIVIPRQMAQFISHRLELGTLSEIGNKIGNTDHATVLHSVKTISNLLDTNKKFRSEMEKFCEENGWSKSILWTKK